MLVGVRSTYYYFEPVKLGDVRQAYYGSPDDRPRLPATGLEALPADLSQGKVEMWTKRSLFQRAQRYPPPPRHHRPDTTVIAEVAMREETPGRSAKPVQMISDRH